MKTHISSESISNFLDGGEPHPCFMFKTLFNSSSCRSDSKVDRTSASEAVDAGSIPVLGQAKDFRKLAFTASPLGVQH